MNIYPETVSDALARWDAGERFFTVAMGGLGPGYEQAIQVGIVEVCRKLEGHELPDEVDEINQLFDETLTAVCGEVATLDGISGAQAGAIKQVAYRYLADGWAKTLESMRSHDPGRLIQISNVWPGHPADGEQSSE